MLSDEELKFISFDENGVLDNELISSYNGESIIILHIS